MKQYLVDLKNFLVSKYDKHLKPHVDVSIGHIEKTGTGKFIVESMRGFSIWVITCLVYTYTHLQIYYEKYKKTEYINDTVDNSVSNSHPTFKIYKYWNSRENSDVDCQGISLEEYLNMVKSPSTLKDDDNDMDITEETTAEKPNWYTLFGESNNLGILIADPSDDEFSTLLKLREKRSSKYISAILKSAHTGTEVDITNLVQNYCNIDGVDSIDSNLLCNLDGSKIYTHDDDVIQLIDNDVNTITLGIKDQLYF